MTAPSQSHAQTTPIAQIPAITSTSSPGFVGTAAVRSPAVTGTAKVVTAKPRNALSNMLNGKGKEAVC